MEGLKISDNRILIPESCYCVLAVRKIKKNTSWKDLDNLVNDPVVKSMYIAVSGVSDRQIKESLCSEYMGIEGMASRMKRNATRSYMKSYRKTQMQIQYRVSIAGLVFIS